MRKGGWLGLVLAASAGCGGHPAEVRGLVRLNGQPLPRAFVQLEPVGDVTADVYYGQADAQGRFVLRSRHGTAVKPGRYVALITLAVKLDGSAPTPDDDPVMLRTPGKMKNSLPAIYSDKERSPFQVTIRPDERELPPFELSGSP